MGQAYEVIENFGQPDRGERRGAVLEYGLDQRRGRLATQKGDDGIGVKDHYRPRRRAAAASARRCCARAVVVSGPRSAYLPCNSATLPSSGAGRITTRSPRSTTRTFRVRHRARVSAGMLTCPFREMVMTWSAAVIVTLYDLPLALYAAADERNATARGRRGARSAGRVPDATAGARRRDRSPRSAPRARCDRLL